MADKKTQLMAQFYSQCLSKGYTDMKDPKQSLKAKVIATDLKLKYGKIEVFFEKAEQCYIQVQNEQESERKAQEAENIRKSVKGELLLTLVGKQRIDIYRRPDRSYYCVVDKQSHIEGKPSLSVQKSHSLSYDYHAPKAVYTGATVGGVTTGGVHVTEGGYTSKTSYSGKGYITVTFGGTTMDVDTVYMSEHTIGKFKRDDAFKSLVHNGKVLCYNAQSNSGSYMNAALYSSGDFAKQMTFASMAVEAKRLPYATCTEIKDLLVRVIDALYPPSDEALYAKASSLAEENNTVQLQHAINLFEKIADYRDSEQRLKKLRAKYADVLQEEKEQAILKRESHRKRNIKLAVILIPAVCIFGIILSLISSHMEKKAAEQAYHNAISLMEEGSYDEAIAMFEQLVDYADSDELRVEALYRKALAYIEQDELNKALGLFRELKHYKDSENQIQLVQTIMKEKANQKDYEAALEYAKEGKYDAACNLLRPIASYADSRAQLEQIVELWLQECIDIINETEDGVIWINVDYLREITRAAGKFESVLTITDYFGNDPMQDDTLFRRIKFACLQGNLNEAKTMLEESGLLHLKPIKTLYDYVILYEPYCGYFSYHSGNRSILENIYDDPIEKIQTWVKFDISENTNTVTGFHLWVNNNDNQQGSYRYGKFNSDYNFFFRNIYKSNDYSAAINEDGQLVFKKYAKGQKDTPQTTVVYTPIEP